MKLLCIGDPHFKIDNLNEVDVFIQELIKYIQSVQVDAIVVLGDLLHTHERLHTVVLNKAIEFINILRTLSTTYILVGNHDYINNTQFLSTNHWMNVLKDISNVVVVDQGVVVNQSGCKLILVPYVYPSRFIEALNIIDTDWKEANVILAHQEFYGCDMASFVSVDGDKWDVSSPFVISGHIHKRHSPQPNIYYTGSSMQHSFGEDSNKSITLCTIEDGQVNVQEVYLKLPTKKISYLTKSEFEDYQHENLLYNKTRIVLHCTKDDFKSIKRTKKYKELIKQGVKIIYKPEVELEEHYTRTRTDKFYDILYDLIVEEKNEELLNMYKEFISV